MINKVLKALKCCADIESSCKPCPYMGEEDCSSKSLNDAINLIISQKEEIERLQKEVEELQARIVFWRKDMNYQPEKIKAEAIKEFWERLKETRQWDVDIPEYVFTASGDNLVKEMAGDDNA